MCFKCSVTRIWNTKLPNYIQTLPQKGVTIAVFTQKLPFFHTAQKLVKFRATFVQIICSQNISKLAQSDHTVLIRQVQPTGMENPEWMRRDWRERRRGGRPVSRNGTDLKNDIIHTRWLTISAIWVCAAIAHWICLLLSSYHLEFKPQHTIPRFNQFIFELCNVEKTKINKRGRDWQI